MNGLSRFALTDDLGAAWLERLPAGAVDALVIDPSAVPAPRRLRGVGDDPGPAHTHHRDNSLAFEVGRVLARGRRAFWICESRHGLGTARLLERYGLDVAAPVIWDRGDAARGGRLRWILAVSKGRVRGLPALPDIIVAPLAKAATRATEAHGLPEAVVEVLVMAGSFAGQWVVEPFMHDPGLAIAVARLGRSYWGASAVEPVRDMVSAALVTAGSERADDGPWALRPRGLEVGPGPSRSSQLSFAEASAQPGLSGLAAIVPGEALGDDLDQPRGEREGAPLDDGARVEGADVRGSAAAPDGVRTGAV